MKTALAPVLALLAATLLHAQPTSPLVDGEVLPGEYPSSVSYDGGAVLVHWAFEEGSARFAVEATTPGWVSLGFGATTMMADADMAFGWAEPGGAGTVLDLFSTGPTGPHPPDTELGGRRDFLAAAATERGGRTTMEFSRPLAAGDAWDRAVAPGDEFIWAIGGDDGFDSYHLAAGRGKLEGAAGQSGSASPGAALGGRILRVLPHAAPLVLSFLLMTAGMLVARYGKANKRWLSIHKPLGAAAAVLGILGLGFGFAMVARGGAGHLRVPHAWIGAATLLAVFAAPVLGQAMFKAKKGKAEIRKAHRWTGRAAILLMALTILSGLVQAGIVPLPGFPK